MKRITFLAAIVALFTINAAKAQVGVHVGLNIGTPPPRPVYYAPQPVVYAPEPVYYEPAPAVYYGPRYHHRYYRRAVYNRGYYGPRRVVVVNNRFHGHGRDHGPHRRW